MRHFVLALGLVCGAVLPAGAQTDYSAMLSGEGLAGTAAALEGSDDPADLFVLGGVRFLQAVEQSFQKRYAMGLNEVAGPLPVLRIGLPPNPSPEPFDTALVEMVFSDLTTGMEGARAALAQIGDRDFAADIDLGAIWFDINANGTADRGEGIFEVAFATAGMMVRPPAQAGDTSPEPDMVRFDRADADWLLAYTHLLSGIGEVVLGFNPTETVTTVLGAEADIQALRGPGYRSGMPIAGMDREMTLLAAYLATIETQPNAENGRAALAHFLAMVAANRNFWTRVAAETDNVDEWIPNDAQDHAFGMDFPNGVGATWQAVLADAEAALKGELLVPYWRIGPEAGLNLNRLFSEPPAFNLIGWIHGYDAVPYMEKGPVMNSASWRAFEQMVSGDGVFFALILN